MKLISHDFTDQSPIPAQFAFCRMDPETHAAPSSNLNPHLHWTGEPLETLSYALICCDPDVPSKPDDVNQEGRVVPNDLPRVNFYHWVLIDIPGGVNVIHQGAHSEGVTPGGKPGPAARDSMRHGLNDYTLWFEGDESMQGDYYGYDGPCPPWNDSIMHHYHFTLYALDTARAPIEGRFNGAQAIDAITPHVLDSACIVGTYSLNPQVAT